MITAKVNGKFIDLDPDMKIQMKETNPLFSETFINDGYSYAFSVPKSEKNKTLLEFKNKVSIQVFYKNNLFIDEKAICFNSGSEYNIQIQSYATEFSKNLLEVELKNLQHLSVEVTSDEKNALEKLIDWRSYMDSIAEIESKKADFMFPRIQGNGYYSNWFTDLQEATVETQFSFDNWIFHYSGSIINNWHDGYYRTNFGVPTSEKDNNWATTIAPCPTFNYILNLIIKEFNLNLVENQLENIPEFNDAFMFNGFVLDQLESFSGENYNVYGTGFDLSNHVPNCTAFDFLKCLNETFGAYFVLVKNELRLKLYRNFNKAIVNISKYASESILNETSEKQKFIFNYADIADNDFNFSMLKYANVNELIYPYNSIQRFSKNYSTVEKSIASIPMRTSCINTGFYEGYARDFDEPNFKNRWYTAAAYDLQLKSAIYTENDIADKIYFACNRGIKSEGFLLMDEMYIWNFKEFHFTSIEESIDLHFIFGNSSVFLNAEDSSFIKYRSELENIKMNANYKTKLIYFPLFELIKYRKWKQFKHVIQQKNESFQGFAKSYSFTLSNQGISATEVEYVVRNRDLKGEFNDDFGNDFNIE